MLNSLEQVSNNLRIDKSKVETVLALLKEGSTVPFIARYRKAATGGLNEEEIEDINKMYQYTVELNKRKEAIASLLNEKGLLTEEINLSILNSATKNELESVYEPFKEGKKTKATEAIALGLEPLAKAIYTENDQSFNPIKEAQKYVNDKVKDVDFAIEQAKLIIAQWMSQDLKARAIVKKQLLDYGTVSTKKKKNAEDEKGKFKQYYDHKELLSRIPDHRLLAIQRGESQKVISKTLDYNKTKITYDLNNIFFKIKTTGKIIYSALEDSLKRLILPSIEREVWKGLLERAEVKAIDLFAQNLEEMLLAPAVKGKRVLAIDPAFASGCKVAVLSEFGDVKEIELIKPTPPFNDIRGSESTINKLIEKHKIDIIVIGNGTASRETESFVATIVKKRTDNVVFAIVSEVGASVYSASKIAIKEFPKLSVEQRSAIHIGRRFQDPLNELVKVDPKSIGVGQYQHDLNQKQLGEALAFKVNKVVNVVGVDVNTATEEILKYISGLSPTVASNIVDHRKENGQFKSRVELKKVKGLGPKAFEQSIGFLRILDSKEFFDRTQIHPESYKLAKLVLKELNTNIGDLDVEVLKKANIQKLSSDLSSNEYDIQLIIDSLISPGKDVREGRDGPLLKSDILSIDNIKVGDIMEGTVQNITDFGAFVYIGLKQAVLIHISNLSESFIKHPSDVVKTGQKIEVEIIGVEKDRERIQGKLVTS